MPMGLCNAPAIHQCRVTVALHKYIGKICHVYLNDIVIWSNTIEEHHRNMRIVLNALCAACLYCNSKKTQLYCLSINFLGHHILLKKSGLHPGMAQTMLYHRCLLLSGPHPLLTILSSKPRNSHSSVECQQNKLKTMRSTSLAHT